MAKVAFWTGEQEQGKLIITNNPYLKKKSIIVLADH